MLSFPTSTVFERRIPKQKFYQNLDVTAEVKRLFIEQIKLITWANKLSAQTMNLAPGQTVQEIEVFRIRMAGDVLDSRVLNLMDKQIPYHLLFVLERSDGKCQLSVTYKEASQSGGSAFQLRQNYRTVWQTPEALTLNLTGLNMDALYEGIVRQIAGDALAAPKAETLQAAVEQAQAWEKLQKQIDQLKAGCARKSSWRSRWRSGERYRDWRVELMPLTKDKYFELIDSNSDYPHFRCALGAYIPGSLYKYFSIPDDSDEARKRFEQLKSGEIWFSKRSGLNDPFEFEHIALKGAQNDARQYYLNKQQELEVCCFSALLYNKLMWSHYAAGYKGYCVEFRVESPERFYPVIYENEVPDLSQEYQRFYDMRNEMCANPSLVLNNYENRKVLLRINYPLFSKDTCWSYEEEYRILDSSTVSNGELQQMTTNGLRVTKIIAGAFCTDLNFQRLKEVAGALNVPLSKIGWDSNLRLNEVPLP